MQGPYKTCLHQDSYTSLNAAPYWKNGQPFDILFFDFHLKECWASTAVKNYSHIKTKLKKNGRGKKYSKGVGPFRFQLSEFQNCPASDMLPQTLKFYLSNAKPYYHRADARWLSPSAFFFFFSAFSQGRNVVPFERARVTHDILSTIHPPGNNPCFITDALELFLVITPLGWSC